MFSFHKPRVYRSTEGCCICRAKSSSSRFTDSRKYETDSMKCFDLKYPRHGEICNACVLLVKRYKRLPVGSNRHWGHVVDARAGPGTKSLSKYKKYREETNDQKNSTTNEVRSNSATTAARSTQSSKSLSEKFSKIFKKTKKINKPSLAINNSTPRRDGCGNKRKTVTAVAHSWDNNQHSLATTPESIESDCEEHNRNSTATADAIVATPTIVEFQTQTRSSASRTRNNNGNHVGATPIRNGCQNRVMKRGSNRRKYMPPRKNRRARDDIWFFDEKDWKPLKSCCGLVYECAELGGALLLDLAVYTRCDKHQSQKREIAAPQKVTSIVVSTPAIVQLTPSSVATTTSSGNSSSSNGNVSSAYNMLPHPFVTAVNPTPILKKHHLFFKRQSESFPHGDTHAYSSINSNTNSSTNVESTANISTAHIVANSNSIATALTTNNISNSTTTSVFANNLTIQTVPRHSTAKVATITPIAGGSTTITGGIGNNNKTHNFLNRIKTDTGKIVKNSWDKLNTAVRLKPSDLQEMKQVNVINAVDKSYLFASTTKVNHVNAIINPPYPHYQSTPAHQATGNSSPTSTSSSSSSSSTSTKFSDNSSDSGFDENTLDRKSASPLQEDMERKLLTRPGNGGVQTMFLASGVQIQGQPTQNIMLSGNEIATKILQNRKHAQSQRNMATAVKITQIVGTPTTNGVGVSSGGSHGKLRAIYNSNNTIQHENGVTTIVPASSIAASTQTAAMNAAMAPSSVTITPAPSTHMVKKPNLINFVGNHSVSNIGAIGNGNNNISNNNINQINNHANITTATTHLNTITNINSNSNNSNNGSSNNSNGSGINSCNNVNASLNTQKIILVKAATKYNNNNPIIKTTTTTNTALNQLNQNVCKN